MPTDEVARIECSTSAGDIVLEMHRQWSPAGYDRAVQLFARHFYDHSHFFRTVPNFLVQFGISYSQDTTLQQLAKTPIPDDPQLDPPVRFTEGTISYAGSGPNSRTSQLFISLRDDGGGFGTQLWETPVGQVVEGMESVRAFYSGYGDMPPWGQGPEQGKIHSEGEAYMEKNFPLMDRFFTCKVTEQTGAVAESEEQRHRKVLDAPASRNKKDQHDALLRSHHSQRSHRSPKHHDHQHHEHHGEEHITGQLHHQHAVHFNADPNTEEGLTKLSWELVGAVLFLFFGVLLLWLRFALGSPSKKSRKTS